MEKLHKVDMRGRPDVNWEEKHSKWVGYWADRASMVLAGHPMHGPLRQSSVYMEWYRANSLILIGVHPSQHTTNTEFGESSSQPHAMPLLYPHVHSPVPSKIRINGPHGICV